MLYHGDRLFLTPIIHKRLSPSSSPQSSSSSYLLPKRSYWYRLLILQLPMQRTCTCYMHTNSSNIDLYVVHSACIIIFGTYIRTNVNKILSRVIIRTRTYNELYIYYSYAPLTVCTLGRQGILIQIHVYVYSYSYICLLYTSPSPRD